MPNNTALWQMQSYVSSRQATFGGQDFSGVEAKVSKAFLYGPQFKNHRTLG